MKRFLSLLFGFMLIILSTATVQAQQGASCYASAYGAASPYPLTAVIPGQTQTFTVPITVTVQTPDTVVSVPAPLAVSQLVAPVCPASLGYAVPLAVSQCGAVGVVNHSYGASVGFNQGFVNRGFVSRTGNFNRFATPVLAGTGVAANFVDRRGNSVSAVGANRVDVRRGIFGGIRSVTVDQRPGLRLPF